MIHPTAVIDPKAQIDSDVEVGPYVFIEGRCSNLFRHGDSRPCGDHRFGSDRQKQSDRVWGRDRFVSLRISVLIRTQPPGRDRRQQRHPGILHDPSGHEGRHIYSHRLEQPSDGGRTSGTQHCGLGNNVILANNVLLGGYAEIHDRVFIGGGSVVHQFTRMGAVSLLQGISGVGKDVPAVFYRHRQRRCFHDQCRWAATGRIRSGIA